MNRRWMRRMVLLAALAAIFPAALAEAPDSASASEIERALYALGYHDDTFDGRLDAHTRTAIRSFQTANDLEVTGEPDAATLECLESGEAVSCRDYLTAFADERANLPILQAGSSGAAVSELQRRLRDLGYFSGVSDGVFGEATQSAVKRFQLAHGLPETGSADGATQLRLRAGEPLSWEAFLQSAAAAPGDSGAQVRRLQRFLEQTGDFDGCCSGSYGEHTQRAVAQFQARNGLEATGTADAATCALLYSGEAKSLRAPGAFGPGDSDDLVSELQRRLSVLGYFERSITGFYGATTETAVRLFQMANGLPSTGEADPDTLERLIADDAIPLSEARATLSAQVSAQNGTALPVVGSVAQDARGRSFSADDEDLYRGFAFVQYVCAAAGIPLASPQEVVSLASTPLTDPTSAPLGEILVCRGADGVVTMAISAGDARAIYAVPESGWVLESELSGVASGEWYIWDLGAAQ